MRVYTFITRINSEALHAMDEEINDWLAANEVTPWQVKQTFAYEEMHSGQTTAPVLITQVWY